MKNASKGYYLLVVSSILLIALTSIVSHRTEAAEIRGKVISVTGQQVQLAIEGDLLPQVGDPVKITFRIPGGPEISVGSWRVSTVTPKFVVATQVEATGKPAVDQLASISSTSPTRRQQAGQQQRVLYGRARVVYQGQSYDTLYQREVENGRPIELYFFETSPAGNVPALVNGGKLWNRFVRDPAADHPDQSKAIWYFSRWEYRDGQWAVNNTASVNVEVFDRIISPAK